MVDLKDTTAERETLGLLIQPGYEGNLPDHLNTLDWGYIMRVASFHKISTLVAYNALRLDKAEVLPLREKNYLEEQLRGAALRHSLFSREIARITSAFNAAGISHLILKGPVLANEVYPSAAARPYGDLDILVPREEHEDAYNILYNIYWIRPT